ncbi:MAG: maltokinase N-terminal cap-like domain-containing protein [Acidimicrobiia bacterium]
MITAALIERLLPDFLPRQRWYGAADLELEGVEVVDFEVLRPGWPFLAWALAVARFGDGSEARFQVPVGARPLEQTERFLEGKGRGFLGDVDTDAGPALVYDALVDPDLCLALLGVIAPDEEVSRVRALNVEQSNTSVVYDERLIMKLFRRVPDGPNPDAEITEALDSAGFTHISAPVATWRGGGRDLAVVRTFLDGGTEGWQLVLTSLRDLYDRRLAPEESGGDFGPEADRLGEITARMHVALGQALGVGDGDPGAWAQAMEEQLAHSRAAELDAVAISEAFDRLRDVAGAGCSIRVHGDYHLGQTMRTDQGWYILDFEGEPALPLEARRRPSSPLRDVAGMLRSFHYASEVALYDRGDEAQDPELTALAARWEDRASRAFMRGYLGVDGIEDLLPTSEEDRRTVLDAFVLNKAVYEVAYELSHRPDWARIPLRAVSRLLAN